jgi:hypothetical protein
MHISLTKFIRSIEQTLVSKTIHMQEKEIPSLAHHFSTNSQEKQDKCKRERERMLMASENFSPKVSHNGELCSKMRSYDLYLYKKIPK